MAFKAQPILVQTAYLQFCSHGRQSPGRRPTSGSDPTWGFWCCDHSHECRGPYITSLMSSAWSSTALNPSRLQGSGIYSCLGGEVCLEKSRQEPFKVGQCQSLWSGGRILEQVWFSYFFAIFLPGYNERKFSDQILSSGYVLVNWHKSTCSVSSLKVDTLTSVSSSVHDAWVTLVTIPR